MLVMDCSALYEMAMRTEAGLALRQLVVKNERVIAPDLLHAEFISVVRKAVRKGDIEKDEAEVFASRALSIVDIFIPVDPLRNESLREGIRLDHSTYDMFYFVLARRTGATLFTVDKQLAALCATNGVDCVEEINWPPTTE